MFFVPKVMSTQHPDNATPSPFADQSGVMRGDGEVQEAVRPVMLSGNLFETLENVDAIANDRAVNQGGGCGKGGQMPLPVANGSPHIRIQNCLISGA